MFDTTRGTRRVHYASTAQTTRAGATERGPSEGGWEALLSLLQRDRLGLGCRWYNECNKRPRRGDGSLSLHPFRSCPDKKMSSAGCSASDGALLQPEGATEEEAVLIEGGGPLHSDHGSGITILQ